MYDTLIFFAKKFLVWRKKGGLEKKSAWHGEKEKIWGANELIGYEKISEVSRLAKNRGSWRFIVADTVINVITALR